MADDEIQTPPNATDQPDQVAPAVTKRSSRTKSQTPKGKAPAPAPAKKTSRGLSEREKLEKVDQIEALVAGGTLLKDAAKVAGIPVNTYYSWKKTVGDQKSAAPLTSNVEDDEFAEFIQLEEENKRLRKLLSEKLRAENADLRKRLGLK